MALGSAAASSHGAASSERRPVIALMVLRDGQVDLERRADGLRNWRLGNPDDRGPGRYKVLALQAERATLRFLHAGIDLDLQGTASDNDGAGASGGAALPTRIDLEGEWRRLRFKVNAASGPVLTFLETGRDFPLRGFLEAGGARLDVDGRAGDIVHEPVIDARVALAAPSLAPFAAFVALPHAPEVKPLRLEGTLKTDARDYTLSAAKARLGATDLAGTAGCFRVASPRNALHAELVSDSTDVGDLRWLAAVRPLVAAVAASSAGRGRERARRFRCLAHHRRRRESRRQARARGRDGAGWTAPSSRQRSSTDA